MNWIVNNKYALAKTTRSVLEKWNLWTRCIKISRLEFEKIIYVPEKAKGYINFYCNIDLKRKLNASKVMYYIDT